MMMDHAFGVGHFLVRARVEEVDEFTGHGNRAGDPNVLAHRPDQAIRDSHLPVGTMR